MSDEKPPMKEHPTLQMPKVTVPSNQLDEVLAVVKSTQAAVNAVANEQLAANIRFDRIEARLEIVERTQVSASLPVKVERATSENAEQSAAIARHDGKLDKLDKGQTSMATRVAALEAEVAEVKAGVDTIKTAVTGFFSNKKVRFVGQVLFLAAMAYAAAHGLRVLP